MIELETYVINMYTYENYNVQKNYTIEQREIINVKNIVKNS